MLVHALTHATSRLPRQCRRGGQPGVADGSRRSRTGPRTRPDRVLRSLLIPDGDPGRDLLRRQCATSPHRIAAPIRIECASEHGIDLLKKTMSYPVKRSSVPSKRTRAFPAS